MKSVSERIEEKALELFNKFLVPTKAYVGVKEYGELNRVFMPKERISPLQTTKISKVCVLRGSYIDIIPTKHESYLRVK